MRGGPIHEIRLTIQGAAGSNLLIRVGEQSIGDEVGFHVDASLFHLELLDRGAVRHLRHGRIEAKVTARPQIRSELTRPVVERGVQMLCRQHRLGEDIAEGGPQSASGRIDVALAAFEAHLHSEIGFSMHFQRAEQQPQEQAAQSNPSETTNHCARSTVNSIEASAPSVAAFILASAPPPVPRSVTR